MRGAQAFTERFFPSVARFCHEFQYNLRGPAWAVGSCSINYQPTGRGNFPKFHPPNLATDGEKRSVGAFLNFSSEWARRIIVGHKKRLDPDWMLESVIKVYNVTVEENPNQGMLSNSYLVQVCYKIADDLK